MDLMLFIALALIVPVGVFILWGWHSDNQLAKNRDKRKF